MVDFVSELKSYKEFLPFLNERAANGRSTIKSIENLVTKKGAKNFITKVNENAKKNYK